MSEPLEAGRIERLLPCLSAVAAMVRGHGLSDDDALEVLLQGQGLDDEEWAHAELRRWASLLQKARDGSETVAVAVEHALKLRGVPEASARLAVRSGRSASHGPEPSSSAVSHPAAAPRDASEPIRVRPDALELGELRPGKGARISLVASGGPGAIRWSSDMLGLEPTAFGPSDTSVTVQLRAGQDGQLLWDELVFESASETVRVPVTARWSEPMVAHPEPVVVAPPAPPPPVVTPAPPSVPSCVAAPRAGDVRVNPKDGAEMVYVPAGEFIMGSDHGESDERPQRTVYLDDFWMYRHEVTVAQYRRFCSETGRDMADPPDWDWEDGHPIVNVSWDDAKAYADWAGVSLPTEAQWEKAARGTDGRKYPWGDTFDKSMAVCSVGWWNARSSPLPVGSISSGASPYGCLDMAGNLWEWCADWYDSGYFGKAPNRNPTGPQTGAARCQRGGSWRSGSTGYFRCAYRHNYDPDDRYDGGGFRCARTD